MIQRSDRIIANATKRLNVKFHEHPLVIYHMYRKHIWKSFAVAGNYFLEYLYCIKFGPVGYAVKISATAGIFQSNVVHFR